MFLKIIQIVKTSYSFNDSKWKEMAVKKLSALLRKIASKNTGDFCCLNCLHSFSTKNKLEFHTKVRENIFHVFLFSTRNYSPEVININDVKRC